MILFQLFLMSIQNGLVMSDLPIHCLQRQVKGEWEIAMSNFETGRNSCGYEAPDKNEQNFENNKRAEQRFDCKT